MPGQRERARRAVLVEITEEGRRQLDRDGAAGLSVRSVARELGMASSAIYRYVASRDELLTMLIVAGYDRLGEAVERAVAGEGTARERWAAGCAAVRGWAAAHPQEYALLYGSPVPGYAAPEDTIPPATRVYAALARPLAGATAPDVPEPLRADGARMAEGLRVPMAPEVGAAFFEAGAALFGFVSLERFGHTHNVLTDHDAWFAHLVDGLADRLGLA